MSGGTCPNGHTSEWDDYCSSCGAPMAMTPAPAAAPAAPAAPAAAAAPGPTGEPCPACGVPREVGAPFCEACGQDLAAPATAPSAAPAPAGSPIGGAVVAVIGVAPAYFAAHSAGSGLQLPDPRPGDARVPLGRDIVLIGRRSDSRGVFPDIDLRSFADDPAASHRHAELRRRADGWVVVDLGSTNGTRLSPDGPTITPGTEVPLAAGTEIYLGAWTVIRLVPA